MRINIGNFPPLSNAVLKVHYYQHLEIEDLSYCLRVPTTYIPKYIGDIARFINTGKQYVGETGDTIMTEEEKVSNVESLQETLS